MITTPLHTYQMLLKGADRLTQMAPRLPWPNNVWIGVSTENPDHMWRSERSWRVPAFRRFLSLESLLAPLATFDLTHIHWVIVGGESRRQERPMNCDWARAIGDLCLPFHVISPSSLDRE